MRCREGDAARRRALSWEYPTIFAKKSICTPGGRPAASDSGFLFPFFETTTSFRTRRGYALVQLADYCPLDFKLACSIGILSHVRANNGRSGRSIKKMCISGCSFFGQAILVYSDFLFNTSRGKEKICISGCSLFGQAILVFIFQISLSTVTRRAEKR